MRLLMAITCLAAASLTIACQSEQPTSSARKLSAAEVRSMFVDMTNLGTNENGQPFITYIAPDGTVKIQGVGYFDTGTYRIESDGRICIKYQKLRQGADTCEIVWMDGTKLYATFPDGKVGVVIEERKPGNTDHL